MAETDVTPVGSTPFSIENLDLSQVALSYDRESDTLMVHFSGRGEPGISIVVDDHLLVRMDRRRERTLGLQIEGFLATIVPTHPRLLDALDAAELRGITPEEVGQIRRTFATEQRRRETLDQLLDRLHRPAPTKTAAA